MASPAADCAGGRRVDVLRWAARGAQCVGVWRWAARGAQCVGVWRWTARGGAVACRRVAMGDSRAEARGRVVMEGRLATRRRGVIALRSLAACTGPTAGLAACLVLALLVAGCSVPRRVTAPGPLPAGAPTTVEGLAAAIDADSRRIDHEKSGSARSQLADEATAYADACLAKAPQAAACHYGRGLALGMEAREHPASAGELLKLMLDSLKSADAADPNYDNAGPSRVRALVLVRAPGWPLGPGDADAGLVSARRAVELRPQYPPNLLALGEALSKTEDAGGARDAYGKARDAALALPATPDRDGWLRDANEGLKGR
jgi:hypothetical protein